MLNEDPNISFQYGFQEFAVYLSTIETGSTIEEEDLVRYYPSKTNGGPGVLEWTGVEFVRRMAALVPPARKHLVRYYGALGPRSPMRAAMREATRARASAAELERGCSVTLGGKIARELGRAARKAGASWAACVRKVFEVDPILCGKCGGEMKLAAVILDDRELDRILSHQGWAVEFPKTKASRAPPVRERGGEESQVNARAEADDGRQEFPNEWPA